MLHDASQNANAFNIFNKNYSITVVFSQGKSFENKIIKPGIHNNGNTQK